MADNVVLNTGVGGDTVAADEIGGVKYTRCKITLGADGTNDGDISATNPLPITGSWAIPTNAISAVGQTSVGTTVVQLSTYVANRGITVKAKSGNAGKIYLGKDSSVSTTTGFELNPGDSISLPLNDTDLIFLISDTVGQSVSWIAV